VSGEVLSKPSVLRLKEMEHLAVTGQPTGKTSTREGQA
jgi:hypothetical protein